MYESIHGVLQRLFESAGWRAGTIRVRGRGGMDSVHALLKLNLAVHEASRLWAVTHAPSGMYLAADIVSKSIAQKIADEIAAAFPDFAKSDEKEMQRIAKSKGRQISSKIRQLLDMYNQEESAKRNGTVQPRLASQGT